MSRETKISEPVVEVAMEKITTLVGGAHQHDIHLADSRDKATVVEALDKLHRAGYELDSSEISAWALSNNGRPKDAAMFRDTGTTELSRLDCLPHHCFRRPL